MNTGVGNVLLVDGRGQRDDAGMPMSHPDTPYHGEAIDRTLDDGVSMNMTPAYEGIADYRRTLRLDADSRLSVVDEVAASSPRRLQWRFQTYRCNPWRQQPDGTWLLFVDGHPYEVVVRTEGFDAEISVQPTHTVWGYVNTVDNRTCHHLSIRTAQPATRAVVRFHIRPSGSISV